LPIQNKVKKPRNSSVWLFVFCRSKAETLGVNVKTAFNCAFELDLYGRTLTTPPPGMGIGVSWFPESVVTISTASVGSEPGVDFAKGELCDGGRLGLGMEIDFGVVGSGPARAALK
jgi:hypothetical protein